MSKISSFLYILFFCCASNFSLAIDLGRIPPNEVSYYVQDLKNGKILYQHNSDELFAPASTMKVVTAFAGFKSLGKNYQWQTIWTSNADIENGHLLGNLVWVGSGDPVLDQTDLKNMQIQLMQKGINAIDGKLILDKSKQTEIITSYGFDDDANKAFFTPPDAHNLAFKVIWLYYYLDNHNQLKLGLEPQIPDNMLDIKLISNQTNSTCSKLGNFVHSQWQNQKLSIIGNIPTSCLGESMYINVFDINQYVKYSFITSWLSLGNSGLSDVIVGQSPPLVKVLAINNSPPLSEIIKDMNKFSNNLIARSIFLEIGKKQGIHAVNAVKQILNLAGINTTPLVLENGSGLSRQERLTAKLMGNILYKSYFSDFKQEMIQSLPIGGVDGTLKKRFHNTSGLHLKTGTLDDVRALAGYYIPQHSSQHPLAIVVFINSKNAHAYLNDLDNLVISIINSDPID